MKPQLSRLTRRRGVELYRNDLARHRLADLSGDPAARTYR